jgi:hypothetical protein
VEDTERDPVAVLTEQVETLALLGTRRIYAEQPDLWQLGEYGRARTLEDFGHHLRRLAQLDEDVFRAHVVYCEELWRDRDFPRQWLLDAWRIVEDVLRDELPAAVADPAIAILRRVTSDPARGTAS